MLYDVIVIGGGPGGYTAALYAARANLSVAILEKLSPGGQMGTTDVIDNYPGFPQGVNGFELAMQMKEGAERFGAQTQLAEVTQVELAGQVKTVHTSGGDYQARTVVLATVKGDIHDIGKNIVKVLLENYGYTVVDLGKDVDPSAVVEAVRRYGAPLVGLSALMTTTLKSMAETISMLHDAGLTCQIMVGGAVLTPDYARQIQADFYARDAKESVDIAKRVIG